MNIILKLCQSIKTSLGWYACAAMVSGYTFAQFASPLFLKRYIPFALLLMLYPMMLEVSFDNISEVIRRPKILLTALIINFLICPLLIVSIIYALGLNKSPTMLIGLLLYATIPCGGMVPAFTGILRGNITLSIAITALSLIASIILVPFWAKLLTAQFILVSSSLIAKYFSLIIIIPLLLAKISKIIVIKNFGNKNFRLFKERLADVSVLGLILLCFIMFAINGNLMFNDPIMLLRVFMPIAIFLLILLTSTAIWCKLANVPKADSIALIISCTAKNNALSLALALTVFGAEVAIINTHNDGGVCCATAICRTAYDT